MKTLNKAEIIRFIKKGNNCEGGYILSLKNEEPQILWASRHFSSKDIWFPIPALDPDGSGQESEDAEWFCENASEIIESREEIEKILEEKDWTHAEFLTNRYPEAWENNRQESAEWLAEQWFLALNGQANDLPRNQIESDPRYTFEWETEHPCNCGSGMPCCRCSEYSPYCG